MGSGLNHFGGRNIIQSLVPKEGFSELPTDPRPLKLACPNSPNHVSNPPSEGLSWECGDCSKPVVYDVTSGGSHFYCGCGRAPRGSHQFQCGGCSELEPPPEELDQRMDELCFGERVIVIMGETGR